MKIAVSNIALPAYEHVAELNALPRMGISAIEVAPSRIWRDTWKGLKPFDVTNYRRQIEDAGLRVVGLHSLLFDQPDLKLFGDNASSSRLEQFFVHLSGICRDLGGKTLIWGGGRHRGAVAEADAESIAADFMANVARKIEDHGTVFCFEPLGPTDSDFINSVLTSVDIVETVNHSALAVQIDAKALAENDEIAPHIFDRARSHLVHVHANEAKLAVVGSGNTVDHHQIGRELRRTGYDGYVSIEQRLHSETDTLTHITAAASAVATAYLAHDVNE